jgi:transcriptional regulator with XRE-family HTH domain
LRVPYGGRVGDLDGLGVGRRIAVLRKRAGLTQAGFAMRVHMSKSWLEKVERGAHVVDSVTVLRQLADALGVPLAVLREDLDPMRPGHHAREPLRRALTSPLLPDPRPASAIETNLDMLARRWHAAREPMATLGCELADLLSHARALAESTRGRQRRQALRSIASACLLAREGLALLGENDLAWIAADAAVRAASEASDPCLAAAAAWTLAHAHLRAGLAPEARAVADRAAAVLPVDSTAAAAAHGSLRLVAAAATAREGAARRDVDRLLDDAMRDAELCGNATRNGFGNYFGNYFGMAFSAANAELHRADVAIQFGDPAAALAACRRADPAGLPTVIRRARHRMHAATAQVMLRHDDEAVRAILAVEAMSPEMLSADSVLARELVRAMLRRKGRKPAALAGLATRLRVAD